MKPKKPLIINTKEGKTTNENEQIKIIREYFKNFFTDNEYRKIANIAPKEMKKPFTQEEIKKASLKLKNNKSPGVDELLGEQVKYGPDIVHKTIADILNNIAKTGDHPKEINTGLLNPLQKSGKKNGPCENLRPIILLSILRKILAICLLDRFIARILRQLPSSQAAYQIYRSRTEQIFTLRLLIDKALTSQDYDLYILLTDMSKAFDMVKRNLLIEDLKEILEEDELHMMKILIDDVKYSIKLGKTIGEEFETTLGIAQGDCLSAILFILYLSKTLGFKPQLRDHNYALPSQLDEEIIPQLEDHNYAITETEIYNKYTKSLVIPIQYADDCGYAIVSKDPHLMNYTAATIPSKLKKRNLICNQSKNEDYLVTRNGNKDYQKCKYLGTLLDTTEDFKRRKILTMSSMNTFNNIWENKHLPLRIKIRIFNACISPVMLAGSELWVLTENVKKQINSFQRKLLRKMINIKWPKKISNESLKKITKHVEWDLIIRQSQVRWYGHALRLPEDTPCKQALTEFHRPTKRPRGGQKYTWIKQVNKELEKVNIDINNIETIAKDRNKWRNIVKAMCVQAPNVEESAEKET